ncbi:AprI/Inh family metalloprotease inhibitor [Salmonella enterica]|nr:AprI/Inh family metalloprotease inhibitor [Salmonella enterica]ELV0559997.1 AprI/Inh family metalloprotease inhibitor [Salmonella enterica]
MKKFFLVVIIFIFSGGSVTSSLILPSPVSLSGHWIVVDKINECDIYLGGERIEQANGYKLIFSSPCTFDIFSEIPEAWRPAPDGISLLNRDGRTVLFFSRENENYSSRVWECSGIMLKKK